MRSGTAVRSNAKGIDMRFWGRCECCECDCYCGCTFENSPGGWTFELAGISDYFVCAPSGFPPTPSTLCDCNVFNGTWSVTNQGLVCMGWDEDALLDCPEAGSSEQVTAFFILVCGCESQSIGLTIIASRYRFPGGSGPWCSGSASYGIAAEDWICDGPNTMTLASSHGCDNWPGTVTLTAVP